jgi:probable DNA metabolism protein
MTRLCYDGTFAGLMTCIFTAYESKLRLCRIERNSQFVGDVFGDVISVVADSEKAMRVWKGLEQRLSVAALHNFYACWLSELPKVEDTMLAFARVVFSGIKGIEQNFSDPAVLQINQIARKVFREKHRMEAFVRFKRTSDGIFYATVEPDHNVLPLIANHFRDRYADQHWVINDTRRKYGIYYDAKTGEVVEVSVAENKNASHTPGVYDADESLYQLLWKDYFKHVNIPSRHNRKLHLQHVPVRYWKLLTEKQA